MALTKVSTNIIQDSAVTSAKIADGAVTPSDLSTGKPVWDASGNLTVSGNGAVGGTLTVTGATTLTGAVSAPGGVTGNVTGNVSGSSGSCTGNASTATKLAAAPAFGAVGAGTQSIASSTWTKATLATKEFDTDTLFSTSTSRFTPNVAGYYQINGLCGTASTVVYTAIYKNGSAFKSSGSAYSTALSAVMYLNGTTDYVELYVYATGAATLASASMNGALIRPV